MSNRIQCADLHIDEALHALVVNEIAPGTGIDPAYPTTLRQYPLEDGFPLFLPLLEPLIRYAAFKEKSQ